MFKKWYLVIKEKLQVQVLHFSRNPSTGENKIYGEYLMNAQGEDVVAGIRTPQPILEIRKSKIQQYINNLWI